ncbi:unnamed protein product [Protopolystoma xenopodis]|uniref:Uncharacterized protein n=1 Tax=Protopolystoma xenopodis TaxID=117903 RepID=A0A448WB82_9PLAT|nr:unnamed protein product [Protopolystoma xenopodis]
MVYFDGEKFIPIVIPNFGSLNRSNYPKFKNRHYPQGPIKPYTQQNTGLYPQKNVAPYSQINTGPYPQANVGGFMPPSAYGSGATYGSNAPRYRNQYAEGPSSKVPTGMPPLPANPQSINSQYPPGTNP